MEGIMNNNRVFGTEIDHRKKYFREKNTNGISLIIYEWS